jgi:hypothetical protein
MTRRAIAVEQVVTFERSALCLFPALSPAQRCVCRLFEGLPPVDAAQRVVYATLLGRAWGPDLARPRRIVVLLAGAGGGKSWLAALYVYYRAMTASLDGLAPGERLWIPIVAPEVQLARVVMGYVAGLARTNPEDLAGEPLADRVDWQRGTSAGLYAAGAGGRSVRGRRFPLVVLDEVAYFRDAQYHVNDQEIVDAVLPRLRAGGQILALTTPGRRRGWVHEMFVRWFAAPDPQALVLRAPTALLNPTAIRNADLLSGAVARRELDAEWVDQEGALADGAWIAAAQALPRVPHDGPRSAALDLAGEGADLTALAIGYADGRGGVVVESVHAWRAQPLEVTIEAVVKECRAAGVRGDIVADPYAFAAAQALFARHTVGLTKRTVTATNKGAMWARVRELLRSGALALPSDPALAHELEAIEVRAGRAAGALEVTLPRSSGGHCDRAQAVALLCDVLAEQEWRGVRPIGWRGQPAPVAADDEPW